MLDIDHIFELLAGSGTSPTDEVSAPSQLTETGSAFKVSDARGRVMAWVYYASNDAAPAEHLTREQALKMAQAIARLPL